MSDVLISLGIDASEVWQTVSNIEAKLRELSTLRLKVDMAELKGSVEASVRAQVAGTGALQRSLSELAVALQGAHLRPISSTLASAYQSLSAAVAGLQSFRPPVSEWRPLTPARQPLLYLDLSKQYLPLQEKVASAMAMSAPQAQLRNVANSLSRAVSSFERSSRFRDTRLMGLQFYLFASFFDRVASQITSSFERAVSVFRESATAFQKARIVTGAAPQQFEQFQTAIRDLAREVMIPVPELAQIAYSFATRGYADLSTITDVLRPLAITSLITGETMDTMARSILSLMQVWNPRTLEDLTKYAPNLVKYFSDMMSFAFAKSPLEVRWFKDIANYAAPLFAKLGYSPQETMAFFMAMAQMIPTPGIGARSARMFLFNVHDIERSMKVMEQYGVNASQIFRQTAQEGGTLAEAFRRLYAELAKLPEETLVSIFKRLGGGVRGGMTAMMLSAGDIISNIGDYIKRLLAQSAGYTAVVGARYRATPIGALQTAEARLSALLQELGSNLAYAKASLIEFKNVLISAMKDLKILPALYGAGAGLQFAARNIFPTIGSIALLAMAGGIKGLKFGIGAAAISAAVGAAIAGIGAAVMKERDKVMQEFIANMQERGLGAVEMALEAVRERIEPTPKRFPQFGEWLPAGFGGAAAIYHEPPLPASHVANLLRDVFSNSAAFVQRIFASAGPDVVNRAVVAAADLESRIRAMFGAFAVTPATFARPKALEEFGIKYLGLSSEVAAEFASVMQGLYTVFSKAGIPETDIVKIIPAILTAGITAKAGGQLEEFSKLMNVLSGLSDKFRTEDLVDVLQSIDVKVGEILQNMGTSGQMPSLRNEPSYAQLLDLWLKGLLPEKSLRTMLPALKETDIPVYREWVPGRYAETVSISFVPPSTIDPFLPAHLDAALKPTILFH